MGIGKIPGVEAAEGAERINDLLLLRAFPSQTM